MEDYICSIYKLKDNQRLFEVTKHKLHDAMQKGSEKSGYLATADKIKAALAPYQAKQQFKTFKLGDQINSDWHTNITKTYKSKFFFTNN